MVKVLIAIPPDIARVLAPEAFPSVRHRRMGELAVALPFGAIGKDRPAQQNSKENDNDQISPGLPLFRLHDERPRSSVR